MHSPDYSEQINRALCFLDVLIKILRKRGHDVVIDSGTNVVIGAEHFKIEVKEKATRSVISNGTSSSSILTPNGKLSLKITGYGGREWKDGKTLLEEQLPDILFRFEQKGEEMRIEKIESERRQQKRGLEAKLKKEREELEDSELVAFRNLMSQALRWQNTLLVQSYLSAVEKLDADLPFQSTNERQLFLEWARKKMLWYDPTVNAKDELLDGVDKHTLNSRRSDYYGYRDNSSDHTQQTDSFWKPFWAKRG